MHVFPLFTPHHRNPDFVGKEPKEFSKKEAQARFEAALTGGLATPPTPLKDRMAKKNLTPEEIQEISDELARVIGNKKDED